jgi:hypothetical protein
MKKSRQNEMLTTNDVVKNLGVPYQTVVSWLKRGLFPGAVQEDSPRGVYWLIPAVAVENFERPAMGRPRKPPAELKTPRRKKSNASA